MGMLVTLPLTSCHAPSLLSAARREQQGRKGFSVLRVLNFHLPTSSITHSPAPQPPARSVGLGYRRFVGRRALIFCALVVKQRLLLKYFIGCIILAKSEHAIAVEFLFEHYCCVHNWAWLRRTEKA